MTPAFRIVSMLFFAMCIAVTMAGCAVAPPRTDDPLQNFNRKVYRFNATLDKRVLHPLATGYHKITSSAVRRSISLFFSNLRIPVTIANDLLQVQPGKAIKAMARFLVNLSLGIGGILDPATAMGLSIEKTDFGITLARWGVPEGPFLMLPLIGPTTLRDIWHLPVDRHFFDPLGYIAQNHKVHYGIYYGPSFLYLISLNSQIRDATEWLDSTYDPYVFLRDAYRQHRLYILYHGQPPITVMKSMQGLDQKGFDPEQLLQEQQQWEEKQSLNTLPDTGH